MNKSIVILQTSQVSSAHLKALCSELIPDVKIHQIIDDSLIDEVSENGAVTKGVMQRLYSYLKAAESLGVDAVLNQCSSVGSAIDALRPFFSMPIIKIDEAMARKAVELGPRIAIVATVASTMKPSSDLIINTAASMGRKIILDQHLVDGAMMLLIKTGDQDKHNSMVIGEIEAAARNNDVVVLAQGSMVVIEPLLEHINKPVLTSPRLGVSSLRDVLYNVQ